MSAALSTSVAASFRKPMKRLAIFVRAPVLGQVKTRLAAEVGQHMALAAYRDLVALTLTRLGPGTGTFAPELWVAGDSAEVDEWRRWFPVFAQPDGDLGARMAAAFEDGVAVLVGCDIPPLAAPYVDSALAKLDDADLVLGPTEDGGYCLIAMKEPYLEVFANIPWSTQDVMAATQCAAAHLRVSTLDRLWDVDDAAGLKRWRGMSGQ